MFLWYQHRVLIHFLNMHSGNAYENENYIAL